MYTQFFRLTQAPFSISPDPRYLFMSERHREALAHLLYGVDSGGGVVLLTGDIGTGKTTVCRCFLEQVPPNCNVAYIFNPKLTVGELLHAICEEFHIPLSGDTHTRGVKDYTDALNRHLLAEHAERRNNVLIIDEAQNLSAEVLEQLRLLTNLETNERKLLQVILIGQPELRTMLARPELEQLAQRVIAHYHLTALSEQETATYIQHRLSTAGLTTVSPFQQPLMKRIHRLTAGVPRRVNLLCDRALLGAYAKGMHTVDRRIIETAATELFINHGAAAPSTRGRRIALGVLAAATLAGATAWAVNNSAWMHSINAGWENSTAAASEGLKSALRLVSVDPAPRIEPTAAPVASIAPAAEPTAAVVAAPVKAAQDGLLTEATAIRRLGQLWGVSLQGDDPCNAAGESDLRCYRSNDGFAELQQLRRPAVLKLQGRGDQTYYALLTALGDAAMTLDTGGGPRTISRLGLARRFRGEFVTLWRVPPLFGSTVETGDSGPAADWVASTLARLYDFPPPPAGTPFTPSTRGLVRQFQQVHGLFVDGIVGPVTVMYLNRAGGLDEPRLQDVQMARQNIPDGRE